jgi:photoactive yellow protein
MPIFMHKIRFAQLRAAYEYWLTRSAGGSRIPDKSGFDPIEMRSFLPNVILVDRERVTGRFRYRLAGTQICEVYGFDPKGRYVDEVLRGEYRDYLLDVYRRVADENVCVYCESHLTVEDRIEKHVERIICPITTNGVEVDCLFIVQHYVGFAGGPKPVEHFSADLQTRYVHLSEEVSAKGLQSLKDIAGRIDRFVFDEQEVMRLISQGASEAVNKVAFGVVHLDEQGTIIGYSREESRLSGLRPEDVLGKNFFSDIAPCTDKTEFRAPFSGVLAGDKEFAIIDYTFPFRPEPVPVQVIMTHSHLLPKRYLLMIKRRP